MFDKQIEIEIIAIYKFFAQECPYLFNHSIVAGGAIRDSLLGVEVKDIDIFVPWGIKTGSKDLGNNGVNGLVSPFLNRYTEQNYDLDYEETGFTVYNVQDTVLRSMGVTHPVQIIFKNNVDEKFDIVKDFPISLSRVYFDPVENKIVRSKAYSKSVTTGIVLYNPSSCPEEYLERMRAKHPNFKFYRNGPIDTYTVAYGASSVNPRPSIKTKTAWTSLHFEKPRTGSKAL